MCVGGQKNRYITLKADVSVASSDPKWFQSYVSSFMYIIGNFVDEIIETDIFKGDGCSELFYEAIQLLFGPKIDTKRALDIYKDCAERGYLKGTEAGDLVGRWTFKEKRHPQS